MSDQDFGFKANFNFEQSRQSTSAIDDAINQIQEFSRAMKVLNDSMKNVDLDGPAKKLRTETRKVVGSVKDLNAANRDSTHYLKELRGEFRALTKEAKLVDFGEVNSPKKFEKAKNEVKTYVRSLKQLEAQVKGNSSAERDFKASLKSKQRALEDQVKIQQSQRLAVTSAARVGEFDALEKFSEGGLKKVTGQFQKAQEIFVAFDDSMSSVAAISGATGKELEALRVEAKRLGATTRYNSKEAADAEAFLASAGFTQKQILATTASSLELASAGTLGLAEAADIASNVLSGLGMKAEEMSSVADILALAAAQANTNVQQLGVAMKYAAPNAALFGATAAETAAILGTMSNAGIQSDMAGTGARNAFLRLAKPAKEGSAAIAELGLTMTDETGNLKNIITIFDELSTALQLDDKSLSQLAAAGDDIDNVSASIEKMGNAKQIAHMKAIFGTTGISAAAAVIKQKDVMRHDALAAASASSNTEQMTAYFKKMGVEVQADDKDIFSAVLKKVPDYIQALKLVEQANADLMKSNIKTLSDSDRVKLNEYFKIDPEKGDIFDQVSKSAGGTSQAIAQLNTGMSYLGIGFKVQTRTAQKMSTILENNLGGSIREFESALESVYLNLFEPLVPVLRFFLGIATKILSLISSLPKPFLLLVDAGLLFAGMSLVAGKLTGLLGRKLFEFSEASAVATIASTTLAGSLIPLTGFMATALDQNVKTNPIETLLSRNISFFSDFKDAAFESTDATTKGLRSVVGQLKRTTLATIGLSRAILLSPWVIAIGSILLLNSVLEQASLKSGEMGERFNLLGKLFSVFAGYAGFAWGILKGFFGTIAKGLGIFGSDTSSTFLAPFQSLATAINDALETFKTFSLKGEEMGQAMAMAIMKPFQIVSEKVKSLWDSTLKAISDPLITFVRLTAAIGQLLVHNLAENSPGPTEMIRNLWKFTIGFIFKLIQKLPTIFEQVGSQLITIFNGVTTAIRSAIPFLTKNYFALGFSIMALRPVFKQVGVAVLRFATIAMTPLMQFAPLILGIVFAATLMAEAFGLIDLGILSQVKKVFQEITDSVKSFAVDKIVAGMQVVLSTVAGVKPLTMTQTKAYDAAVVAKQGGDNSPKTQAIIDNAERGVPKGKKPAPNNEWNAYQKANKLRQKSPDFKGLDSYFDEFESKYMSSFGQFMSRYTRFWEDFSQEAIKQIQIFQNYFTGSFYPGLVRTYHLISALFGRWKEDWGESVTPVEASKELLTSTLAAIKPIFESLSDGVKGAVGFITGFFTSLRNNMTFLGAIAIGISMMAQSFADLVIVGSAAEAWFTPFFLGMLKLTPMMVIISIAAGGFSKLGDAIVDFGGNFIGTLQEVEKTYGKILDDSGFGLLHQFLIGMIQNLTVVQVLISTLAGYSHQFSEDIIKPITEAITGNLFGQLTIGFASLKLLNFRSSVLGQLMMTWDGLKQIGGSSTFKTIVGYIGQIVSLFGDLAIVLGNTINFIYSMVVGFPVLMIQSINSFLKPVEKATRSIGRSLMDFKETATQTIRTVITEDIPGLAQALWNGAKDLLLRIPYIGEGLVAALEWIGARMVQVLTFIAPKALDFFKDVKAKLIVGIDILKDFGKRYSELFFKVFDPLKTSVGVFFKNFKNLMFSLIKDVTKTMIEVGSKFGRALGFLLDPRTIYKYFETEGFKDALRTRLNIFDFSIFAKAYQQLRGIDIVKRKLLRMNVGNMVEGFDKDLGYRVTRILGLTKDYVVVLGKMSAETERFLRMGIVWFSIYYALKALNSETVNAIRNTEIFGTKLNDVSINIGGNDFKWVAMLLNTLEAVRFVVVGTTDVFLNFLRTLDGIAKKLAPVLSALIYFDAKALYYSLNIFLKIIAQIFWIPTLISGAITATLLGIKGIAIALKSIIDFIGNIPYYFQASLTAIGDALSWWGRRNQEEFAKGWIQGFKWIGLSLLAAIGAIGTALTLFVVGIMSPTSGVFVGLFVAGLTLIGIYGSKLVVSLLGTAKDVFLGLVGWIASLPSKILGVIQGVRYLMTGEGRAMAVEMVKGFGAEVLKSTGIAKVIEALSSGDSLGETIAKALQTVYNSLAGIGDQFDSLLKQSASLTALFFGLANPFQGFSGIPDFSEPLAKGVEWVMKNLPLLIIIGTVIWHFFKGMISSLFNQIFGGIAETIKRFQDMRDAKRESMDSIEGFQKQTRNMEIAHGVRKNSKILGMVSNPFAYGRASDPDPMQAENLKRTRAEQIKERKAIIALRKEYMKAREQQGALLVKRSTSSDVVTRATHEKFSQEGTVKGFMGMPLQGRVLSTEGKVRVANDMAMQVQDDAFIKELLNSKAVKSAYGGETPGFTPEQARAFLLKDQKELMAVGDKLDEKINSQIVSEQTIQNATFKNVDIKTPTGLNLYGLDQAQRQRVEMGQTSMTVPMGNTPSGHERMTNPALQGMGGYVIPEFLLDSEVLNQPITLGSPTPQTALDKKFPVGTVNLGTRNNLESIESGLSEAGTKKGSTLGSLTGAQLSGVIQGTTGLFDASFLTEINKQPKQLDQGQLRNIVIGKLADYIEKTVQGIQPNQLDADLPVKNKLIGASNLNSDHLSTIEQISDFRAFDLQGIDETRIPSVSPLINAIQTLEAEMGLAGMQLEEGIKPASDISMKVKDLKINELYKNFLEEYYHNTDLVEASIARVKQESTATGQQSSKKIRQGFGVFLGVFEDLGKSIDQGLDRVGLSSKKIAEKRRKSVDKQAYKQRQARIQQRIKPMFGSGGSSGDYEMFVAAGGREQKAVTQGIVEQLALHREVNSTKDPKNDPLQAMIEMLSKTETGQIQGKLNSMVGKNKPISEDFLQKFNKNLSDRYGLKDQPGNTAIQQYSKIISNTGDQKKSALHKGAVQSNFQFLGDQIGEDVIQQRKFNVPNLAATMGDTDFLGESKTSLKTKFATAAKLKEKIGDEFELLQFLTKRYMGNSDHDSMLGFIANNANMIPASSDNKKMASQIRYQMQESTGYDFYSDAANAPTVKALTQKHSAYAEVAHPEAQKQYAKIVDPSTGTGEIISLLSRNITNKTNLPPELQKIYKDMVKRTENQLATKTKLEREILLVTEMIEAGHIKEIKGFQDIEVSMSKVDEITDVKEKRLLDFLKGTMQASTFATLDSEEQASLLAAVKRLADHTKQESILFTDPSVTPKDLRQAKNQRHKYLDKLIAKQTGAPEKEWNPLLFAMRDLKDGKENSDRNMAESKALNTHFDFGRVDPGFQKDMVKALFEQPGQQMSDDEINAHIEELVKATSTENFINQKRSLLGKLGQFFSAPFRPVEAMMTEIRLTAPAKLGGQMNQYLDSIEQQVVQATKQVQQSSRADQLMRMQGFEANALNNKKMSVDKLMADIKKGDFSLAHAVEHFMKTGELKYHATVGRVNEIIQGSFQNKVKFAEMIAQFESHSSNMLQQVAPEKKEEERASHINKLMQFLGGADTSNLGKGGKLSGLGGIEFEALTAKKDSNNMSVLESGGAVKSSADIMSQLAGYYGGMGRDKQTQFLAAIGSKNQIKASDAAVFGVMDALKGDGKDFANKASTQAEIVKNLESVRKYYVTLDAEDKKIFDELVKQQQADKDMLTGRESINEMIREIAQTVGLAKVEDLGDGKFNILDRSGLDKARKIFAEHPKQAREIIKNFITTGEFLEDISEKQLETLVGLMGIPAELASGIKTANQLDEYLKSQEVSFIDSLKIRIRKFKESFQGFDKQIEFDLGRLESIKFIGKPLAFLPKKLHAGAKSMGGKVLNKFSQAKAKVGEIRDGAANLPGVRAMIEAQQKHRKATYFKETRVSTSLPKILQESGYENFEDFRLNFATKMKNNNVIPEHQQAAFTERFLDAMLRTKGGQMDGDEQSKIFSRMKEGGMPPEAFKNLEKAQAEINKNKKFGIFGKAQTLTPEQITEFFKNDAILQERYAAEIQKSDKGRLARFMNEDIVAKMKGVNELVYETLAENLDVGSAGLMREIVESQQLTAKGSKSIGMFFLEAMPKALMQIGVGLTKSLTVGLGRKVFDATLYILGIKDQFYLITSRMQKGVLNFGGGILKATNRWAVGTVNLVRRTGLFIKPLGKLEDWLKKKGNQMSDGIASKITRLDKTITELKAKPAGGMGLIVSKISGGIVSLFSVIAKGVTDALAVAKTEGKKAALSALIKGLFGGIFGSVKGFFDLVSGKKKKDQLKSLTATQIGATATNAKERMALIKQRTALKPKDKAYVTALEAQDRLNNLKNQKTINPARVARDEAIVKGTSMKIDNSENVQKALSPFTALTSQLGDKLKGYAAKRGEAVEAMRQDAGVPVPLYQDSDRFSRTATSQLSDEERLKRQKEYRKMSKPNRDLVRQARLRESIEAKESDYKNDDSYKELQNQLKAKKLGIQNLTNQIDSRPAYSTESQRDRGSIIALSNEAKAIESKLTNYQRSAEDQAKLDRMKSKQVPIVDDRIAGRNVVSVDQPIVPVSRRGKIGLAGATGAIAGKTASAMEWIGGIGKKPVSESPVVQPPVVSKPSPAKQWTMEHSKTKYTEAFEAYKKLTKQDYSSLGSEEKEKSIQQLIHLEKELKEWQVDYAAAIKVSTRQLEDVSSNLLNKNQALKADKLLKVREMERIPQILAKQSTPSKVRKAMKLEESSSNIKAQLRVETEKLMAGKGNIKLIQQLEARAKITEEKWKKTVASIDKEFGQLAYDAAKYGYQIQKGISEGSPGPSLEARENWEHTSESIQQDLRDIAPVANIVGEMIEGDFREASHSVGASMELIEHEAKHAAHVAEGSLEQIAQQAIEDQHRLAQLQQASHAATPKERGRLGANLTGAASHGIKTALAVGGAISGAGYAVQGIGFSLQNLGVISQETGDQLYKFSEFFNVFSSIGMAITPLMGAIGSSMAFIVSLVPLIFNPITLGIGLAVAGLFVLNAAITKVTGTDHLGAMTANFLAPFQGTIDSMKQSVMGLIEPFKPALEPMIEIFKGIWEKIAPLVEKPINQVKSVWQSLTTFVSGIWDKMVGVIADGIEPILNMSGGLSGVLELIQYAWQGFSSGFGKVLLALMPIANKIDEIVPEIAKNVISAMGVAKDTVVQMLNSDWMQQAKSNVIAGLNFIGAAWIGVMERMVREAPGVLASISRLLVQLLKDPLFIFKKIFKKIMTPLVRFIKKVGSLWSRCINIIKYSVGSIGSFFANGFDNAKAIVLGFVTSVGDTWNQFIETIKSSVGNASSWVQSGFSNFLTVIITKVSDVKSAWDRFVENLKGTAGTINETAMAGFNKMMAPILEFITKIKTTWDQFTTNFQTFLSGIPQLATDTGTQIVIAFAKITVSITEGIAGAFTTAIDQVKLAWTNFTGWFGTVLNPVTDVAQSIGTKLVNFLNHGAADVTLEAWNRTAESAQKDMKSLIPVATKVGGEISEQLSVSVGENGSFDNFKENIGSTLEDMAKLSGGAALTLAGGFGVRKLNNRMDSTSNTTHAERYKKISNGVEKVALYGNAFNDIAELAGVDLPDFVDPLIKATTVIGVLGDVATEVIPFLMTGITALGLPCGVLVGAIGGVVLAIGGLYLAWQNNLFGIQELTFGAITKIQSAWTGFTDWFGKVLNPVTNVAQSVGTKLVGFLNHGAADVTADAWDRTTTSAKKDIKSIIPVAKEAGHKIANNLTQENTNPFDKLMGSFKGNISKLMDFFKGNNQSINPNKVQATIPITKETGQQSIENLVPSNTNPFSKLMGFFKGWSGQPEDPNKSSVTKLIQNDIDSDITTIANGVEQQATTNSVVENINPVSRLMDSFRGGLGKLTNFFKENNQLTDPNKAQPSIPASKEVEQQSITNLANENTNPFSKLMDFFKGWGGQPEDPNKYPAQLRSGKSSRTSFVREEQAPQDGFMGFFSKFFGGVKKLTKKMQPVTFDYYSQLDQAMTAADKMGDDKAFGALSELQIKKQGLITADDIVNLYKFGKAGELLGNQITKLNRKMAGKRLTDAIMGGDWKAVKKEIASSEIADFFWDMSYQISDATQRVSDAIKPFTDEVAHNIQRLQLDVSPMELMSQGPKELAVQAGVIGDSLLMFVKDGGMALLHGDVEKFKGSWGDLTTNVKYSVGQMIAAFQSFAITTIAVGVFAVTSISPILLIMAAIAFTVAVLMKNFLGLRSIIVGFGKTVYAVGNIVLGVFELIGDLARATGRVLKGLFTLDVSEIKAGFADFKLAFMDFQGVLDKFVPVLKEGLGQIGDGFRKMALDIAKFLGDSREVVAKVFDVIANTAKNGMNDLTAYVVVGFQNYLDTVRKNFPAFKAEVELFVQKMGFAIYEAMQEIPVKILGLFTGLGEKIKNIFKSTGEITPPTIKTNFIEDYFATIQKNLPEFKAEVAKAMGQVSALFAEPFIEIPNRLREFKESAESVFEQIILKVKELTQFFSDIGNTIGGLTNGFKSIFGKASGIGDAVKQEVTKIGNAAQEVGNEILQLGNRIDGIGELQFAYATVEDLGRVQTSLQETRVSVNAFGFSLEELGKNQGTENLANSFRSVAGEAQSIFSQTSDDIKRIFGEISNVIPAQLRESLPEIDVISERMVSIFKETGSGLKTVIGLAFSALPQEAQDVVGQVKLSFTELVDVTRNQFDNLGAILKNIWDAPTINFKGNMSALVSETKETTRLMSEHFIAFGTSVSNMFDYIGDRSRQDIQKIQNFTEMIGDRSRQDIEKVKGVFSSAGQHITGMFRKTQVEVAGSMEKMEAQAAETGYSIEGKLSEHSPGPTWHIRKKWMALQLDLDSLMKEMALSGDKTGEQLSQSFDEAANRAYTSMGKIEAALISVENQTRQVEMPGFHASRLVGQNQTPRAGRQASFGSVTRGRNTRPGRERLNGDDLSMASATLGGALGNFSMAAATPLFLINDFVDVFQVFGGMLGKISLQGLTMGKVFTFMGVGLQFLTAGFMSLMTVLGPILLIVGAIALAGFLLYRAYKDNFMGIQTLVDAVGAGFVSFGQTLKDGVFGEIGGLFTTFETEIRGIFQTVGEVIGMLFYPIGQLITSFKALFGLKDEGTGLKDFFVMTGKVLAIAILIPLKITVGILKVAISVISGLIKGMVVIGGVISAVFLAPIYLVIGAIQILVGIFQAIKSVIEWVISKMGELAASTTGFLSKIPFVSQFFKPDPKATPPGYKEGGLITGPGSGVSDSIPIMASSGEFMVTAAATKANYPLLEAINNGETMKVSSPMVVPPTPPVMVQAPVVATGGLSTGATGGSSEPIQVHLHIGEVNIQGVENGVDAANEFLDQIGPQLRRAVLDILRDSIEFKN